MHNEGNYKQCEKAASEWEKIIANKTTDKELISKIYMQFMQLNTRNINDPIKKWAKELISSKKMYRWLINTWKDAQYHTLQKCKSKPLWGIISHKSEWLLSKSLQKINAREGVEKRESFYTVGGNANWYSHYGEQCGDSSKTRNRTAIGPSDPIAGHTLWGNQNWKRHI